MSLALKNVTSLQGKSSSFCFHLQFFFSHDAWFKNHDSLCFPVGKLVRHLRQSCVAVFSLTSTGVTVKEALSPSHKVTSMPAEVEPLKEYQ